MYIFKNLGRVFFLVSLFLVLQILNSENINAWSNEMRVSNRYFEDKFEMFVPALPVKYNNVSSNLEDVDIEILSDRIVINGLIPDHVYNDVIINFKDDIGRKYEFKIDNVITSQATTPNNKFVFKAYENGLGRKPDHEGFKYWYNRLYNKNITAVAFVNEMINSVEFNTIYETNDKKISALYRIVVGREPDEQGFNYWLSEFSNMINNMKISPMDALINIANIVMKEDEFVRLIEKTDFVYSN